MENYLRLTLFLVKINFLGNKCTKIATFMILFIVQWRQCHRWFDPILEKKYKNIACQAWAGLSIFCWPFFSSSVKVPKVSNLLCTSATWEERGAFLALRFIEFVVRGPLIVPKMYLYRIYIRWIYLVHNFNFEYIWQFLGLGTYFVAILPRCSNLAVNAFSSIIGT